MPKTREPLITHLQGREELLEIIGFPRQKAEWITLVCLHSGLFTRDQLAFYLQGANRFHFRRFVRALLTTRVSGRPFAGEGVTDGRLICRIFGKQISQALEIPHTRHRREASIEVMRRRLLSLDFVLDHLELPWLPTEQEKVSCFERLGIERDLLPRRIYAGHAKGLIHYFPLKTPVAVGPEAAVFVYVDPGMGTRSELDSWGEAHRRLWEKLRRMGRRVEVVAVAWEQELLDRAGCRLRSWVAEKMSEGEKEALMLRQAISDSDWDSVERHGGFNAVVEKILYWERENPAPKGRAMIDRFRLWGSRRCRHMGDHLTQGGGASRWCTILAITNLHYQRAKPSPLWSRRCPGIRIGRGLARITQILCGKAPCGGDPVCPRLAGRAVAPHGRGGKWRERPPSFRRWCGARRVKG